MKAMILAAGLGSRLGELTKDIPKPLIDINGQPLMDIILKKLRQAYVTDVMANTYYLADQIIDRYKDSCFGLNFNWIKEEELSGTAGGLKKCQAFFEDCNNFYVIPGDALFNVDLENLMAFHESRCKVASILLKNVSLDQVSNFGVVIAKDDLVEDFQEKPSAKEAKSTLVSTGIYAFNKRIFDYIPENTFYDFAKDVFPVLVKEKQLCCLETQGYWNDIGTIRNYKRALAYREAQ